MTRRTETGVMMMTTEKAFLGTHLAASLHKRSAAEDVTEATMTFAMSSTAEMHATELKDDTNIGSVKSKNCKMKGNMIIMVFTMTNLTGSGHQKRGTSQEASRHIP
jgi:hypothetical protein